MGHKQSEQIIQRTQVLSQDRIFTKTRITRHPLTKLVA